MMNVKFGKGDYDLITGICEFKVAPEFYGAFNTKPQDVTARITFSKQDGAVRFELIVVGKEDAAHSIGTKAE